MRTTHKQALSFITTKISEVEPNATAREVKIIEHEIEGMAETVKIIARVDDDDTVVSDALIEGLKGLTFDATNGVSFLGTKMDWGRDKMDFVLLIFSVDMMKNCGVNNG
ncbi:hypothetical protein PGH07_07805 [Sulfurovum sp. zt1-1]|uniref:Uncharacterized protein n=1 Tax=Sulfurovum zhangzhouensis TaxID=3019067 RepID=A0ABT7QZ07_9BACT|nr:hypothetical protein [Sulfurovum zhangzhouensis]MDM5272081.1 hypothetical protein [Sulfurovum zhangzhouensis]